VSSRLYRLARAVALVLVCSAASACARPVGDLGRAKPGVLHDEIMPTLGRNRAQLAKEPVSSFNLSDQERDMHNRVWRFLVAPHAEDWFMDTAVELQRTRMTGARDHKFERDRYYEWLHESEYRSSRIRYNTVADHAQSDINTSPQTFTAICRVIEMDRQRSVASRELNGLSYGDVAARRAENDMFIAWFTRALSYRYDAYSYALDHLLVETPHEEAVGVDGRLSELAIWVERAERGDFCFNASGTARGEEHRIPSRVLTPVPGEGIYKK
jgi:hypothetical protein